MITEIAPGYRLDFLYDENNQLYGFIYNNSDKYFYIRDFMQNILGIIDTSGNLVVKYGYTAYGKITDISGSLAATIGACNPFRYKGYYYDTETTMYYCKTRYYVPEWCRWLNGDNLGFLNPQDTNGLNLFIYCSNNPITGFDVDGQFDWGKLFRGLGALAIGALVVTGIAAVTVISGGTAAPVVASALIGATVSGGVSIGCQLATTGTVDVSRLLTDVAVGAVSGAFGGTALGTFGMTVSGTVTGFGGSIVGDLVETGSFNGINWGAAIGSAALGGVLSYMGGAGAQNGKLGGVAKMQARAKIIKTKGITGRYASNTQKYLAREISKVNKAAIQAIKKSVPYTIFSNLIDYFI